MYEATDNLHSRISAKMFANTRSDFVFSSRNLAIIIRRLRTHGTRNTRKHANDSTLARRNTITIVNNFEGGKSGGRLTEFK